MWDRVDTSLQFGRLVNGVLVCSNGRVCCHTIKLYCKAGNFHRRILQILRIV